MTGIVDIFIIILRSNLKIHNCFHIFNLLYSVYIIMTYENKYMYAAVFK